MTRILNSEHVSAMVKALRKAGLTVKRDTQAGTVECSIPREPNLFRALKTNADAWIVTHHDELFVTNQ